MFFPYVHCYVIFSNYEKGIYTQSQVWQSFCSEEEENRTTCHWGAWPYLYTHIASILILNLISCLIRGFVTRLIVMLNPYWQRLAFHVWDFALSALQSHLPLLYLGSSALSCLEITTLTWDLRVSALRGMMICSPCPGREA